MSFNLSKVWFQNRRAKYRKQEKQLQKALAPSVLPSCNGMMRNIQGYSVSRGYQPYPHPNSINRYPQVNLLLLLSFNFNQSSVEPVTSPYLYNECIKISGSISNGCFIVSWDEPTIFDDSRIKHGIGWCETRLNG